MKMGETDVIKCVTSGNINKAIQLLLQFNNVDYNDELIHLKARFNLIEKEKRMDTISNNQYSLQVNKIVNSIISIYPEVAKNTLDKKEVILLQKINPLTDRNSKTFKCYIKDLFENNVSYFKGKVTEFKNNNFFLWVISIASVILGILLIIGTLLLIPTLETQQSLVLSIIANILIISIIAIILNRFFESSIKSFETESEDSISDAKKFEELINDE